MHGRRKLKEEPVPKIDILTGEDPEKQEQQRQEDIKNIEEERRSKLN
jgi:hypothetical protein